MANIVVTNMSDQQVTIYVPELMINKTFPKKGASITFDSQLLKDAFFFNYGVETLLREGTLYIEDMEFKRDLGLEPPEATQPVNIIKLDEKQLKRIIKLMPVGEVKETLAKLSGEQRRDVVEYAISHSEDLSMDRVTIISQACECDLLNAIRLRKQSEE